MQLANKITVGRIFLIPVIIGLILLYANSIQQGNPRDEYRLAAIACFLIAALSDALDGYIARKYGQRTWIGEIMDPLADKALLMTTILALSLTPWPQSIPLWFPGIIIFRDVFAIAGGLLVYKITGTIEIKVHWTGKVATFLQVCAVMWVMVGHAYIHPIYVVYLASAMTMAAGLVYLRAAYGLISKSRSRTRASQ